MGVKKNNESLGQLLESPALIQSFADKTGKSVTEVEKLWKKAKQVAAEQGFKDGTERFFKFTVGVLKRMLGITNEFHIPVDESKLDQLINLISEKFRSK